MGDGTRSCCPCLSPRVEFVYRVGGYKEGGVGAIAVPVDRVLTELLQRLERYVEKGTPTEG